MNLFREFMQGGAGGAGGSRTSPPVGPSGPPTDLFGQPWTGLGAGPGGGAGGYGGGGNAGAPVTYGGGGGFPGAMNSGAYGNYGSVGTMPPGGYGVPQGAGVGTGEGGPQFPFDVNDPVWQSIFGYGPEDFGGGNTAGGPMQGPQMGTFGNPGGPNNNIFNDPFWQQMLGGGSAFPGGESPGGGMTSGGPYPSGIDFNDPIWQSILDPVGYYGGEYGQGQGGQDITPSGLAGGSPDYLSPNFDWASWLASGGDPWGFGGEGDMGDNG